MTAKEYLSQARYIDKRIERKIEERDRLREKLIAGRMAQITGMPRGGNYDWTDGVNALIALEEEINREIMELCRVKREVWAAIDAVDEGRFRWLLELRYRNYLTWEQIADEMGYDVRWVYRMHGAALAHIQVPKEAIESHA